MADGFDRNVSPGTNARGQNFAAVLFQTYLSDAPQAEPQAAGFSAGLSAAPQALPQAAGVSAGLSAAPHAAGVSAGLSAAPQALPQAAGFSAGLSAAPHAVPQAAAFLSSAHPAMLDNAMILSSFMKCTPAGPIAFCAFNISVPGRVHKNAPFYYIVTFL